VETAGWVGAHFFKFLIFDWWIEFGKIRGTVCRDFESGAISSFRTEFSAPSGRIFSFGRGETKRLI